MLEAQHIVQIEYFFDQDPGYGNGQTLEFTSVSDVSLSVHIPVDELSNGFHTVNFRAKDQTGTWGQTFAKPFLKEVVQKDMLPDIVEMEYFIDNNDPGFGLAMPVEFNQANQQTVSLHADIQHVKNGLHTISFRVKDENDKWSFLFSRQFIKKTGGDGLPKITGIEYFYNDEPGFGHASFIASTTPTYGFDSTFSASIGNLSGENQRFYLRAKDEFGNWSMIVYNDFKICEDVPPLDLGNDTTISLYDMLTLEADDGYQYLWNTGSISNSIQIYGTQIGVGTHKYSLRITDSKQCMNYDTILVTVKAPNTISTQENNQKYRVFPNPTQGEISIYQGNAANEAQMFSCVLFDALNRKLVTKNCYSGAKMDLKSLSDGIYFLRIASKSGCYTVKIIKR